MRVNLNGVDVGAVVDINSIQFMLKAKGQREKGLIGTLPWDLGNLVNE